MIPGQAPVRMDETTLTDFGYEWDYVPFMAMLGKIEPIEDQDS